LVIVRLETSQVTAGAETFESVEENVTFQETLALALTVKAVLLVVSVLAAAVVALASVFVYS
jgi:hypothetical protein